MRIHLQLESVRGNYAALLTKGQGIKVENEMFSGIGYLIFAGNGKIREFSLGDADSIIVSQESILAQDITTRNEPLSTSFLSLVKISGPGMVFVRGEDFVEFYLDEEETTEVRTVCIVAMDSTITYQLASPFSALSGPGAVLLKSAAREPEKFPFFEQKTQKEPERFPLFEQKTEKEPEKFPFFDQL